MAAIGNGYFLPQGDFRAAIAPLRRHGGKRTQGIHGGNRHGRQLHPLRPLGKLTAQPGENIIFQGGEPLFGGEHLGFQLFEFLGNVAFAVCQGLLADVALGHLVNEGLGHLDVIAEHPVIAHLEGADAGFFPLIGLNGGNGAGAALHNVPQLISLGICALADDAALPDGQGRIVHDGLFNQLHIVFHGVDAPVQLHQHGGFQLFQLLLYLG